MAKASLSEILNPATLASLDNYQLLAKVVVEGFMAGLHRSVYRGVGSEFLQYRDYVPGDDTKYLDWKVYGKSDRFYTKVFQEETNFDCALVLDASGSMGYKGKDALCSKLRYGAMISACLAHLAARQGDNVGFFAYNNQFVSHIPPGNRSGNLRRIFSDLSVLKSAGNAEHDKHLGRLSELLRRRGLVVIISDFLDCDDSINLVLKRLRFSGHECVAFQILDHDEVHFPFDNTIRFEDSESGTQIVTAPANVRRDYQRAMSDYQENLGETFRKAQIDFRTFTTSHDLGDALAAYLYHRRGVYGC